MTRKRLFDLTVVIIGFAYIWPIFVFIALLILIFDGRPVLFVQPRIGLRGQPFNMFKFRSMERSCDRFELTVGQDTRISFLGHYCCANLNWMNCRNC